MWHHLSMYVCMYVCTYVKHYPITIASHCAGLRTRIHNSSNATSIRFKST